MNMVEINDISFHYADVPVLEDVNLEVRQGDYVILTGENGSGKSTFLKLLLRELIPQQGSIKMFEKDISGGFKGMKIGYVPQNSISKNQNFPATVEEIMRTGLYEPIWKRGISGKKYQKRILEALSEMELDSFLTSRIGELSGGQQQRVMLARALVGKPELLILDEPTASLGEGEIEPFLNFVKRLTKELHISVIYITHKLEEIFTIADKVTVMADGKKTMTADIPQITQEECVRAMIRSDKIKAVEVPEKDFSELEKNKILEVQELTYDGRKHAVPFFVCKGEVVGFYGLVGAGRTETMEVISGIRMADKKEFTFDGEVITGGDSYKMIQKGMILTPELRINGIFPTLNLVENVCTLFVRKFATKIGMVKGREGRRFTEDVLKKNGTKYTSKNQLISELSGGNMQKIIIGRSVEVENLKLLTVDEPTAGLDLGAKSEIYLKIRNLADKMQKSVVFISSELEELMKVCDRMYIFYNGDVVKELKRKAFDKEAILGYALGGVGNGR